MYSGLGGHASVVFSYLSPPYLDKYKHHIIFFGVEPVSEEYIELCNAKGIDYTYIKKRNLSFLTKFYNAFQKCKADLIITHSLPTVPVLLILGCWFKFKTVLVDHAALMLKRKIDIWASRLALRYLSATVFLSEYAKSEVQAYYKSLNQEKYVLIPNGIDVSRFVPPSTVKVRNDYLTIFTHGRIVAVKDLKTLILAGKILREKGIQFKIIIAGIGSDLMDLTQVKHQMKLDDEVEFAGLLNEDEIINHLQQSDVYVNCSLIEGMSTSLLQAMSCGLPCIVSDIPANRALVSPGFNGSIFEVGNAEALADKIHQILIDPQLVNLLSKNARKYAEENLSNQKMIENYMRLTKSVLNV